MEWTYGGCCGSLGVYCIGWVPCWSFLPIYFWIFGSKSIFWYIICHFTLDRRDFPRFLLVFSLKVSGELLGLHAGRLVGYGGSLGGDRILAEEKSETMAPGLRFFTVLDGFLAGVSFPYIFGFLARKSIFWYNIGQFNSRLHSSVVVTLVLDAQEVDIWMGSVFQEISSPF